MNKIFNEKVVKIFLCLQPVIDIINYFVVDSNYQIFSVGTFIRMLFLVYCVTYLLFADKEHSKKNLLFLSILALPFFATFINNYFIYSEFSFIVELKTIFKVVYFPILLLFYFRIIKKFDFDYLKLISINTSIICLTIILSKLFNIDACSYGKGLFCIYGSKGWFYSANEISNILVMCICVNLYSYFKKNNYSYLFVLIVSTVTLLLIGTKSTYIALLATFVGVLFFQIIRYIFLKDKNILNKILFLCTGLLVIIISTPATPVCINNRALFRNVGVYCTVDKYDYIKGQTQKHEQPTIPHFILTLEEQEASQEKTDYELIMNGRDAYVAKYLSVWKTLAPKEKLLGIGGSNEYFGNEDYTKVTERDFHDLYFQYGVFGIIAVLIFPAYMIVVIIKNSLFKKGILSEVNILLLSIALIFFSAGIAGHALISPSVTIYIALLLALIYKLKGEKYENEK